jgi:hypothetical protein
MAQKTKSESVVTVVSEAIGVRRPIRQAAPPVSRSTWPHDPVDWLVDTHPGKERSCLKQRLALSH